MTAPNAPQARAGQAILPGQQAAEPQQGKPLAGAGLGPAVVGCPSMAVRLAETAAPLQPQGVEQAQGHRATAESGHQPAGLVPVAGGCRGTRWPPRNGGHRGPLNQSGRHVERSGAAEGACAAGARARQPEQPRARASQRADTHTGRSARALETADPAAPTPRSRRRACALFGRSERRYGSGSLSRLKAPPSQNGGVGAEAGLGPLHPPRALLRGARRQPQPAARALPEGLPQQSPRTGRGGRFARGEDAPNPEDPGGQECGGPELPFHPAGAGGHQRHHGLQPRPRLPLQRLGRSPLHHDADGVHRLHGAAFWGPHEAWAGLPLHLPRPPVSPALPADSVRAGHHAAGVQHAHCGHWQAPSSCHQLPEWAHRPALSHHNFLALCWLLGTHLHVHPGDGRPADGADLHRLPGLSQPHPGTGDLLLGCYGQAQERVTGSPMSTTTCGLQCPQGDLKDG